MLGRHALGVMRVVQNDAFDQSTQVCVGKTRRGREIWLDCELIESDLLILMGLIEHHLFAGFSGGGKSVMPGMAGLRTILGDHGGNMIDSPSATGGVTRCIPVWEEIREMARILGDPFLGGRGA